MLNVDYNKSGTEPESLKWTIRQTQKEQSIFNQQEAVNQMASKMFGGDTRNLESPQRDDSLQKTQKA